MKTYAIDFETYYDEECSIKTLGPRGYFSHPSFDAYMLTVVGDDGFVYAGHPKDFDWQMLAGQTALAHNASFDESLYLYGVEAGWYPKVEFGAFHCTADMCAALGKPRSLKNATAEVFGLEITKTTRDNMKGKQWSAMPEEFRKEVTEYAIKDSELCLRLWQELSDGWPEFERGISSLNRRIGQRGIPIDEQLLHKNLGVIKTALYDAEQSIPWIKEYTPLSRKAFNEQCRKEGITPPKSLAQDSDEADAWFAAHQQACPWARAVQSYRRINAFMRKLESFTAGTMSDSRYYGGLMYFGASTGRFSGSGGNLNLQNLPRGEMFGVDFRSMIRPQDGHKLIVADLSQIEVRTLCWLAGDRKALELIRDSEDIYHAFGVLLGLHDPANGQLKKFNPELRHKVKSIVLGCFEPDTLVLTKHGWERITDIQLTDQVWDGEEWVAHQGVICQGTQETIRRHGVGATADHGILTEHGWREWREVATNPSLMKSAIRSASLPSTDGSTPIDAGSQRLLAPAGGSGLSQETILSPANQHGVIPAPSKSLLQPLEPRADMSGMSRTTKLASGSLIESQRALTGATTPTTPTTDTTADGAYPCTSLGGETENCSLITYQNSRGGMTENSNWTESTTTEDTSQTTLGSSPDPLICETDDLCPPSKSKCCDSNRKSKVYDISFAGPRNRFTILTADGPMLVHNCGYGMGANRFSSFSGLDAKESESSVGLYRQKMKKIVDLWRHYDDGLTVTQAIGEPYSIMLPSGRGLHYGTLKRMRDPKTGRFRFIGKVQRGGRLMDFPLWGGVLSENSSQGLARDIFSDMMLRVDALGYRIILHVHDEMVIEVPDDKAEQALADVLSVMSTAPDWIPDIPLSADAHIVDFYSK